MLGLKRWVGEKKNFREESPLYRQAQTNLTNGAYININLEAGAYQKYDFFNFVSITNNTNQTLYLVISGKTFEISAGVIKTIDEATVPSFRSIQVYNSSGSTATGTIEILWQKVLSTRQILRQKL